MVRTSAELVDKTKVGYHTSGNAARASVGGVLITNGDLAPMPDDDALLHPTVTDAHVARTPSRPLGEHSCTQLHHRSRSDTSRLHRSRADSRLPGGPSSCFSTWRSKTSQPQQRGRGAAVESSGRGDGLVLVRELHRATWRRGRGPALRASSSTSAPTSPPCWVASGREFACTSATPATSRDRTSATSVVLVISRPCGSSARATIPPRFLSIRAHEAIDHALDTRHGRATAAQPVGQPHATYNAPVVGVPGIPVVSGGRRALACGRDVLFIGVHARIVVSWSVVRLPPLQTSTTRRPARWSRWAIASGAAPACSASVWAWRR